MVLISLTYPSLFSSIHSLLSLSLSHLQCRMYVPYTWKFTEVTNRSLFEESTLYSAASRIVTANMMSGSILVQIMQCHVIFGSFSWWKKSVVIFGRNRYKVVCVNWLTVFVACSRLQHIHLAPSQQSLDYT